MIPPTIGWEPADAGWSKLCAGIEGVALFVEVYGKVTSDDRMAVLRFLSDGGLLYAQEVADGVGLKNQQVGSLLWGLVERDFLEKIGIRGKFRYRITGKGLAHARINE